MVDVALSRLDMRLEGLRLGHPAQEARVRRQMERGPYLPVMASDQVEANALVLFDGFKRARAARNLGWESLRVQVLSLDAAAATAAILLSNNGGAGLTVIEEGLVVQELHRRQGLNQLEIAARLDRHKSWVCRRLQLVEDLHADVLANLRVGLVSATHARQVARLPRGNQPAAAESIQIHQLTSREASRLVDVLRATPAEQRAAVLADPSRHLPSVRDDARWPPPDPRLGTVGNQLRAQLLRMESAAQVLCVALRGRSPGGLLIEAERDIVAGIATPALRTARQACAVVSALCAGMDHTEGDGDER